MNKVTLALVVHAHQPVGNFDHVFEEAYQKAYSPFVRLLLKHPGIRLGLHFSGCLLEWLEKHHPKFFDELRELAARGQVELMGGGFFEPILSAISDRDQAAQLQRLNAYLQTHFGTKPRGAWVAERVWAPGLLQPLAEAGLEYVVLDDTHFLAAGVEPSDLHRVYLTEELGWPLRLVPSLKRLRYTIPFRDPQETIDLLRQGAQEGAVLFAAGDDAEKFGVWPGTFEHCYANGWLKNFFKAVEDAGDWLKTSVLSDLIDRCEPLDRVYLPTASYPEMMEWALPNRASQAFRECVEESEQLPSRERFARFLRGATWPGFFSKYPESNQIHKLMLDVSRRLNEAESSAPPVAERRQLLEQARTHLLAGQCNDAYWHGLFGGLYSPHLRHATLQNLIRADSLLGRFHGEKEAASVRMSRVDFDADGADEILFSHRRIDMVLKPSDGATVSSIRFKPASAELVNSLARRPEVYHGEIRSASSSEKLLISGRTANAPEDVLRYDRYLRHCFRTYLFPASKQWKDFERLNLQEEIHTAGNVWEAEKQETATGSIGLLHRARFESDGVKLEVETHKVLGVKVTGSSVLIECRSRISSSQASLFPLSLGLEMVFNLLAPNAPDRYFLAQGKRYPLEFAGEIDSARLDLVDEWQNVRLQLQAQPRRRWWIVPIETVSKSEASFERVYQGSAILAVWNVQVSLRPENQRLEIEIASLK